MQARDGREGRTKVRGSVRFVMPDDADDRALTDAEDRCDESSVATSLAHLIRYALYCETVGIVLQSERAMRPHLVATAGVSPGSRASWWQRMRRDIPDLRVNDEVVSRPTAYRIDRKDHPLPSGSSRSPARGTARLALPLYAGDRRLGALLIEFRFGERIMPDVLLRARSLAQLVALGLDHERLTQEREQWVARETELRQENERLEMALVQAVHELRSPLTTMKLGMQVAERQLRLAHDGSMLDESAPDRFARATTSLSLASSSTGTAERLLSDLSDTVRIRNGMAKFRLTHCDLAQLVQETVAGQRMAWPKRIIHLDAPYDAVPVVADPDRISQVVSNYISNALKYSPDYHPIEVHVEVTQQDARVLVGDHGPGLAPDEQQRIWERFHRGEGHSGQNAPGLGVGLFICRQLIEQMHGQVGIESALGEGSTFWFTVPLAAG